MTALAPARTDVARPSSPTLVAARYLLRGYLRIALWYVGAVLALGALIPLLISRSGDVGVSIVAVSWQAGVWFGFSLNATLAVTYLGAHVSLGMTRRSYWQAVLLAAGVFGTALAAFQTGVLALERWWFGAMGWRGNSVDGLVVSGEGWGPTAGRYLLLYLTALVCGAVVSLVYARFGGWVGTLCLPVTVGPLLVVGALLIEAGDGSVLSALGVPAAQVDAVATVGAITVLLLLAAALVVLARGFRLTTPPR